MLHKENDLRWLIRKDEPTKVKINIFHSRKLQHLYQELIYQFDSLDMSLLRKKAAITVRIIDYVIECLNMKDIKKLENASTIMRALMVAEDPDENWLFDVDIAETKEQKWLITDLAVKIKQYNKAKKKEKGIDRLTLEQRLAKLNLGFHLNVKKTSVLQFIAYQKEAIERSKQLQNG